MNVSTIKSIVQHRFHDIEDIDHSIFKASSSYAGKKYALWIFDCSQTIACEGFDLRAYQDRLLRDDFYRFPGALQWNLYCYFLCDEGEFQKIRNRGLVTAVESDREYARKFVKTPSMLKEELDSLNKISTEANLELPQDVGSIWQNKLKENGLDSVYLDIPYVSVIRQIKSEQKEEIPREKLNAGKTKDEARIEFIEKIELNNYRRRPITRHFEFGRCNLIHGVNGSGKTSLLEAIEVWICGKYRRNKDEPIVHDCLKLKLRGKKNWRSGPSKRSALYRQRDHAWYGNYQARKNVLCSNFARFNFYDSDAAARLEISQDDKDIQTALSRLILGEAATKLAERVTRLIPELKKEERDFSNRVSMAEKLIQKAIASNKELELPANLLSQAYERFLGQVKETGWRGELPSESAEHCLQFLRELNESSATIEYILSELTWLPEPSPAGIDIQLKAITECEEKIEKLVSDGRRAQQEKDEIERQISNQMKKVDICYRWLEYSRAGATQLVTISENYNKATQKKKSLLAARDELVGTDIQQYAEVNEMASAMYARIQADLERKEKIFSDAHTTVTSLEEMHGKIKTLVTEIRTRATDLFEIDAEAVVCPVCGAQYQRGELHERVKHQMLHEAIPELRKAHEKLARMKEEVKDQNRVLRDLEKIQAVAEDAIGITSPGEQAVRTLIKPLLKIERAIAESDRELDRLQRERANLEVKGFTKLELLELSQRLASLSPDITRPVEATVEKLHCDLQKAIELGKRRLIDLLGTIDKIAQCERTLLVQFLGIDFATIDTLNTRFEQLISAKNRLESLNNALVVPSDQPLSSLNIHLNSLGKSCERYVRLQQKDESIQRLIVENQSIIQKAEVDLKNDRPILDRLRHAVSVLERLTREDPQENHVQKFFSENLSQIGNLFCAMHAPRDFKRIEWATDPMGIRAVRISDSISCSVSQLSSGQRNALSLAIFLTMNRKLENAPSLILLDDPVAHVDDLNIVSFFDCLREMLLTCDRQVFFATASSKTANLFQKKFDFLGHEEFRFFHLEP